jgi:flagellar biogenesis protein FliO
VKTTTLVEERIGDLSPLSGLGTLLRRLFANVRIQRRERKLRLCDSLALGEKRMIAVVEFEQQRFLVAATPHSISLLQALPASANDEIRAPENA